MSDENENEGILASLAKTIGNNWRLILVGVIILAIALNSSWSGNKSSSENNNEPTSTPQTKQSNQIEQNKPEEAAQAAENSATSPAPANESKAVSANTNSNANTIIQVAAKSEGVTHLARRAIKEYLGNANENLSAEQKIYAEDYLRKQTGKKALEIGEKIEFSTDLIKQSVEKAKGLSEGQIKNLSKYVPLVKNLN